MSKPMTAFEEQYPKQARRIIELEEAMQEFVDRCAKGEVRSKYTRAKFEQLLDKGT